MNSGCFGAIGNIGGLNFSFANGVTPLLVMDAVQGPINALNQQITVLLEQVAANPTPDQPTLLQLQMYIDQFNNDILLASSMIKAQEDSQKAVINNIGN